MKRYLIPAVCMAAVCLGACSNESKLPVATGKGNIRAINAIPSAPAFSFLIEERLIGSVDYRASTVTSSYDDLEYTFNFEVLLAGDSTRTRVASQFLDVEADKDYTFIIGGTIAAPVITLSEGDVREWSGDETAFEARFANTAATLGDVDVYFAEAMDPPTAPVAGAASGTLAFGEFSPAAEFAEGEYILTVTPAGDETTILFQSEPFTPAVQTSIILSVFDSVPNDLAPAYVSVFSSGSGGALVDSRFRPTIRFFHASIDAGDVDIYVDDPLGAAIVSDHMFGAVTGDIDVPAGDLPLTYTTAGGMGSILIDEDRTVFAGTRSNYYLIKSAAGEDAIVTANLDRRSVETFARLSIINTAANHGSVDVYIVEVDALIDEALPAIPGLTVGSSPAASPFPSGSYDIYVTASGAKDVIVGPVRLDVAAGDIIEIVVYDNIDPAIADLVFIPQP
ncbi:MAG: DUF4397 domain-containing protein [Gammaproteobacteria bacterium]|nr:DUF4397 domain-containing protein [Gammaproteobacteria bacterium]